METAPRNCRFLSLVGGSQKGCFQKCGFGRCSPVPTTGTRAHSDVPRHQKPERGDIRMFPGTKNLNGTFALYETALLFPLECLKPCAPKPYSARFRVQRELVLRHLKLSWAVEDYLTPNVFVLQTTMSRPVLRRASEWNRFWRDLLEVRGFRSKKKHISVRSFSTHKSRARKGPDENYRAISLFWVLNPSLDCPQRTVERGPTSNGRERP